MGEVLTIFIFTILLTSFSTPAFSAGPLVGGTFILIDNTTLLIAGLSTNFSILAMLGIVGSVTFAALYFSTKRKSKNF